MLRCPFNGFTKCNNECPFSTENLTRCDLQRCLAAIEGVMRGMHSHAMAVSDMAKKTYPVVGSIAQCSTAAVVSLGKIAEQTRSAASPAQEQPKEVEQTPPQAKPLYAEDWVAAHDPAWFDGKTTDQVWCEFINDCRNGRAIKRTTLNLSHARGADKTEHNATQHSITALVKRIHADVALCPSNDGRARAFVSLAR